MIGHVDETTMGGHHPWHTVVTPLRITVFDEQPATSAQQLGGHSHHPTHDVEAVGTAIEGDCRVVPGNFRIARHCVVGNVRRVASDDVHASGHGLRRCGGIAGYHHHRAAPLCQYLLVRGDVAFKPATGVRVQFHRPHGGARPFRGQRQGNHARTRAEVHGTRRRGVGYATG